MYIVAELPNRQTNNSLSAEVVVEDEKKSNKQIILEIEFFYNQFSSLRLNGRQYRAGNIPIYKDAENEVNIDYSRTFTDAILDVITQEKISPDIILLSNYSFILGLRQEGICQKEKYWVSYDKVIEGFFDWVYCVGGLNIMIINIHNFGD